MRQLLTILYHIAQLFYLLLVLAKTIVAENPGMKIVVTNEDILDVRLAEVCRQLEKTNHTILQIGRDCGFNDPDHLKRIFKKRYGVSMRERRKKINLGFSAVP